MRKMSGVLFAGAMLLAAGGSVVYAQEPVPLATPPQMPFGGPISGWFTPCHTPTPPWTPGTPIPTPTPGYASTPCPTPIPSPSPTCASHYRGPYYGYDYYRGSTVRVETTNRFDIGLYTYFYDLCCECLDTKPRFIYDSSVIQLVGVQHDYGVTTLLTFDAISTGTTELRVQYDKEPSSQYLISIEVKPYSGAPVPTPIIYPTPTIYPDFTCTPVHAGPFIESQDPTAKKRVGEIVRIRTKVTYYSCICCNVFCYPREIYNEDMLRFLRSDDICGLSEYVFQALRPGKACFGMLYNCWPPFPVPRNPWSPDGQLLSEVEILPPLSPTPSPTPVYENWIAR